jgi:hypothetical protein
VPTVAVFAEILIVGLEAAVWILLTILTIFGNDWVDPAELEGWETLVTVLILASAYVLGVLMDRMANTILTKLRPDRDKTPERKWATARLEIMARIGGVSLIQFLEYLRSRVRIARGTVVNFFLIALATLAFGLARTSASKSPKGIGFLVVSVAILLGISFASFFAWSRLNDNYLADLKWVKDNLPRIRSARQLQGQEVERSVTENVPEATKAEGA